MSHKCHNHKSCCHGDHNEACHTEHEECCGDHHHHHDEECCFSKQLLELADEAWMEILKDKIKAKIEASSGKNLDQLAQLVSDANHERWKSKLGQKSQCDSYKQKIEDFFKSK